MLFKDLGLIEPILRAVKAKGYETPTPIQERSIKVILDGKDLLGTAQTGTGKTAAYALPILQMLFTHKVAWNEKPRALILAPTRELALQIKENFRDYGRFLPLKCTVIYGGVSQVPQVRAIKNGTDILVATPGRLLDLMGQKHINLSHVKYIVLDEADQMLDMGFINDVQKIIEKVPEERQTLLFSATMPPEISKLSDSILKEPERVSVAPVTSTVDTVEQSVYFVDKRDKTKLLIHLIKAGAFDSSLIFSRTKHGANRIMEDLIEAGIKAEAIHGNKSQAARQQSLRRFREHRINVLVATDIAARGIDVTKLSYVINYDLPEVPETYIHRIGRTGRAGLSGKALSFCGREELHELSDIEKLIGKQIPVVEDQPYPLDLSSRFSGIPKKRHYPPKGQNPYFKKKRPPFKSYGKPSGRRTGYKNAEKSGTVQHDPIK